MSKKCTCVLCGKEYETCNCSSDKKNNAWKIICDSSEHYQIHMILNDYCFKNIDKKHAKELLSRFDLSDYKNFEKSVVKLIDDILVDEDYGKSQKKVIKNKRTVNTVKVKNK